MQTNRRLLIVDDNRSIHDDFRSIFAGARPDDTSLNAVAEQLFGKVAAEPAIPRPEFELTSAYQGAEALEHVQAAAAAGKPFALAFVDVRMPPGWDGVETIERLWRADPHLQAVICTAFSDYTWGETVQRLGYTDRLLILKKPFENVEVLQMAVAMTEKWTLAERCRRLRAVVGSALAETE